MCVDWDDAFPIVIKRIRKCRGENIVFNEINGTMRKNFPVMILYKTGFSERLKEIGIEYQNTRPVPETTILEEKKA